MKFLIILAPFNISENWSDILDQSSYRDVSSNFSPEDESIYNPYTSHSQNLLSEDEESNFLSNFLNNLPVEEDDARQFDKYRDSSDSELLLDRTSFFEKVPCEVGAADDCPFNSECIPLGLKTRNGICKCVPGTEENRQGACVQLLRPFSKGPTIPMDSKKNGEMSDLKADSKAEVVKTIQNLTVSILSKEVK